MTDNLQRLLWFVFFLITTTDWYIYIYISSASGVEVKLECFVGPGRNPWICLYFVGVFFAWDCEYVRKIKMFREQIYCWRYGHLSLWQFCSVQIWLFLRGFSIQTQSIWGKAWTCVLICIVDLMWVFAGCLLTARPLRSHLHPATLWRSSLLCNKPALSAFTFNHACTAWKQRSS
jgi:hypothetical protein